MHRKPSEFGFSGYIPAGQGGSPPFFFGYLQDDEVVIRGFYLGKSVSFHLSCAGSSGAVNNVDLKDWLTDVA